MTLSTSEIIIRVCGVYALCLIVFGTIGNVVTCIVCLRKELRKRATFVFMGFLVISDTCSLYFWNLNHFLQSYYGYIIESYGLAACKSVKILQYTTLQSSAWILVAMNIERCVLVCFKFKNKIELSTKQAVIIAGTIPIVIFFLNLHLAFTIEFEPPFNRSNIDLCYSQSMNMSWQLEHLIMQSVIPWILLVISNTMLILKTVNKKVNSSVGPSTKRQRMSFSIALITLFFIICTLPESVIGAFFLNEVFATPYGLAVVFMCDSLVFSYQAFNFVVFMIWNKRFRSQLRCIIRRRDNRISTTTTHYNKNMTF